MTVTIKSENINYPKIGEGVFLIRDVSEILQLPYSKVRHWLIDFWEGRCFGEQRNRSINFYTLIEFYTFYQLRSKGLSSQKVQKYHHQLSKDLKTYYPFARTIFTDGRSLWYEALGELIKADGKLQIDLKDILESFLHKIEFDSDGLAKRYFPLNNSKNIVIDPKHQFGSPTITGTNIKTLIINDFYKSGESVENICNLYNITEIQVLDAIQYYNRAAHPYLIDKGGTEDDDWVVFAGKKDAIIMTFDKDFNIR